MEYDGWATGLPLTTYMTIRDRMHSLRKEQIVRCKECRYARETDIVEQYHLECIVYPLSRHFTRDDDFCSHGERR